MTALSVRRVILPAVILLAFVLIGSSVSAQYHWMYPGCEKSVSLQMLKPKITDRDGFGTLNTVWYLSGKLPVGDRLSVVIELPVSNLVYESEGLRRSLDETMIGHPYLGVEARLAGGDSPHVLSGRIGFRPPLGSDEKYGAAEIGLVTDYHRLEAFYPDHWSVTTGFGYSHTMEGGFRYAVNLDGVYWTPTEDDMDSELFLDYNLTILQILDRFRFGAGLAGRWVATTEDGDFEDQSMHQVGFTGTYDFGSFRPGLELRFPLDEPMSELLDCIYGFTLTLNLD